MQSYYFRAFVTCTTLNTNKKVLAVSCEVRIFAPRMKQLLAILFVSFALAAVGVLECLPHHHHGDKVCFAVEQAFDHHEGECCDHPHHTPEAPATKGGECCSLVEMLQHQLASTEVRCEVPCDVEAVLPAWCEVLCEECASLPSENYGENCFIPPLYESPHLGIRALRAPPVA